MSTSTDRHVAAFASLRPELVSLAYRMLGDMARAEDVVQDAWLRFAPKAEEAASARAYLVTVVTRLCLNELESIRVRMDRLPEPIASEMTPDERLAAIEDVSMALLVVLQSLTPAERAALLLHDVFDFDHDAIAGLLGKSAVACRKLLERARQAVAAERRSLVTSPEEHGRILRAFVSAARVGDTSALVALLADDAIMISDGGPNGVAIGGTRNLARPLHGSARIAAFVSMATRRGGADLRAEERVLNGRPAVVFYRGEALFAALLLAVGDGKILRVFFHADAARLGRCASPSD